MCVPPHALMLMRWAINKENSLRVLPQLIFCSSDCGNDTTVDEQVSASDELGMFAQEESGYKFRNFSV